MVCWYGPHISTMILPPCGWYGATSSTRRAGSSARGLDQYRVLHFAKVHLFFCPQAFSGSFWWEASENAIKFAKIGGAPSPLNVYYTARIIARSPILFIAKFSTQGGHELLVIIKLITNEELTILATKMDQMDHPPSHGWPRTRITTKRQCSYWAYSKCNIIWTMELAKNKC